MTASLTFICTNCLSCLEATEVGNITNVFPCPFCTEPSEAEVLRRIIADRDAVEEKRKKNLGWFTLAFCLALAGGPSVAFIVAAVVL